MIAGFSPHELSSYLVIGAILFCLGLFTVLTRRNAISVLMGVELILNSANINYVAFSHFGSGNLDGQLYAIFVIMLAAFAAFAVWTISVMRGRIVVRFPSPS